jgi:hypothetical protein
VRRINPETNKPFKQGDIREDGYRFSCYLLNKTDPTGFYLERWYSPGSYTKYKTKANELNKKNNAKKQKKRKNFIDELKMKTGCIDCGYSKHPEALQFDHLPGFKKHFEISKSYLKPLEEVLDEIKKCEVVCACCHAIRTHNRRTLKINQQN